MVAYREDIINFLENESDCIKGASTLLADRIGRGKGLRRMDVDMLRQEGVAEWKTDFLSGIAYLFNRAHGIAYCMQIWRLAYYKVHYPDICV
jgi:DNA polymerase-3 subunit alpha (Gram-positive type)